MRHGEVFNPEKVLYGRLPGYKLSELGLRMADRAAQHFQNNDLALIVSSPLERAQQTAAPTANSHNLKPELESLIIEAENIFEGKRVSVGDGALRDPRNWWYLRNPIRPSWGEPYKQIADRMRTAIFAARDLHKEEKPYWFHTNYRFGLPDLELKVNHLCTIPVNVNAI